MPTHTIPYSQTVKLKYILITILIGIITYLPSLFGQFVWDDEDFVNQNTYVISHRYDKFYRRQLKAGKLSNYYRPIQMSAYSLVHQLVGFNPPVYHAINIIVHIAAALVLYYFLLTLTSLPLISYISSILFLIHPPDRSSQLCIGTKRSPCRTFWTFSRSYFL